MPDLRSADIDSALRLWAIAAGCRVLGWSYRGTCIEARVDAGHDVVLCILAPTLAELVETLAYELAEHRRPRLRLVRGGKL
jgi:hypothetical protein